MTVKALVPVRMNLVVPLPHEGTATRSTETAGQRQAGPGAVTPLSDRQGDLESTSRRSTRLTTPGTRTSTTATRTTTTRATRASPAPSADSSVAPFSFESLVAAYLDCRRNKRNSASALAFEAELERNLCNLYERLVDGSYRPGRSICFVVTRPKPREVWAADFADRVVHHLLYNEISPGFHAAFVADSCACIPGRGTLYAARRLEHQVRSATENWSKPAHYLKCDLANFFVAIDKRVLRQQLHARILAPWWRWLADTILLHDPRTDVDVRSPAGLLALVPPHKSLFNAPAERGLPIGNLSSQFFANVFLNDLDQLVKHQLRAPRYIRYVDDFILIHESPAWLGAAHARIEAFLPERLGVELNPRKTILQPVARGIDFVGHVIRPWHRTTRPRTVRVALRRLATMPAADVWQVANSYLGLLGQASHSHHDRAVVANAARRRGHSVSASFTRVF
jgi:hypothetical protein